MVDRDATVHIGLEGAFGSHDVSPRTLTSTYMTHLVKVEGIITKCSMVRPKVARSVHFCPATVCELTERCTHSAPSPLEQFPQKAFHQREYRDATSLEGAPTGSVYPTKDEEGNPLETEFGLRGHLARSGPRVPGGSSSSTRGVGRGAGSADAGQAGYC